MNTQTDTYRRKQVELTKYFKKRWKNINKVDLFPW